MSTYLLIITKNDNNYCYTYRADSDKEAISKGEETIALHECDKPFTYKIYYTYPFAEVGMTYQPPFYADGKDVYIGGD